jgi:hypothetical protein
MDGCGMSWSVSAPKDAKATMAEHRQKFHHVEESGPKGPRPRRSLRA